MELVYGITGPCLSRSSLHITIRLCIRGVRRPSHFAFGHASVSDFCDAQKFAKASAKLEALRRKDPRKASGRQ
eukprot:11192690-Lingulodinium_polyedra.AAC.1